MPTDETIPTGPWKFDREVAEVIPDMVGRSVPSYAKLIDLVTDVAGGFARQRTGAAGPPIIADLGTGDGAQVEALLRSPLSTNARYRGFDRSEEMLEKCRERLRPWAGAGADLRVEPHDLREGLPCFEDPPAVIVLGLTMMFVPVEHRQRLLAEARRALAPEGALILVEKVLGESARLDALLVDHHHTMKARHGYTPAAIEAKRASLQGVLVPLPASGNERLLAAEGFDHQLFWAEWNFRAWVAVPSRM